MNKFALVPALLALACIQPRQNTAVEIGLGDASTSSDDGAAPPSDTGTVVPGTDAALDLVRPEVPASTPDAAADSPLSLGDGAPAPDAPAGAEVGTPDVGPAADTGPSAKLPAGRRCAGNTECESNHCVEEVCCATACTGSCTSCRGAETGGADGTCAPVLAGRDPRGQCAPGTPPCGQDGLCDGAGKCRVAPTSVSCGAPTCSGGYQTAEAFCNGAGACATPTPVSCGVYPCVGTTCPMSCSPSSPCIDGYYCAAGKCVAKKAAGASCDSGTECGTGNCVERVCCDTSCNTKCYSCLATATGVAQGSCAPVRAGLDPNNQCQASAMNTCREDGFCDGNGGCRMYPINTPCRTESCSNGATESIELPAGTCNGAGLCSDPSPRSCNGYTCGPSRCKMSCTSGADCSSSYYCDLPSSTCRVKKGLSAPCGSGTECGTGICGGRCCAQACTCPVPSAANRLANPGFDSNDASWDRDPMNYVGHHAFDGTDCSYSGSIRLTPSASHIEGSWALIHQCAGVNPGTTYNFGGRGMAWWGDAVSQSDFLVGCRVSFHGSPTDCQAGANPAASKNIQWSSQIATRWGWVSFEDSLAAPAGAAFARFECEAIDDSGTVPEIYLDNLFLSPAPAKY
jgi:hypothetical protein